MSVHAAAAADPTKGEDSKQDSNYQLVEKFGKQTWHAGASKSHEAASGDYEKKGKGDSKGEVEVDEDVTAEVKDYYAGASRRPLLLEAERPASAASTASTASTASVVQSAQPVVAVPPPQQQQQHLQHRQQPQANMGVFVMACMAAPGSSMFDKVRACLRVYVWRVLLPRGHPRCHWTGWVQPVVSEPCVSAVALCGWAWASTECG